MGFVSGVFHIWPGILLIFYRMIWLEILVGLALIIGFCTSIYFMGVFILLIFFTILTDLPIWQSYVPSDKISLDFSAWGDCMIKIKCACQWLWMLEIFWNLIPKFHFLKMCLLVPGLIFLIWSRVRVSIIQCLRDGSWCWEDWLWPLGLPITIPILMSHYGISERLKPVLTYAIREKRNCRQPRKPKSNLPMPLIRKQVKRKRLDYAEYMKDFKNNS